MKRGYPESTGDGPPKSRFKYNHEGDAHFPENFVQKVADHYSARTNQTLEEREASPIIHLKKLNNWIKSVLVQLCTCEGDVVLDLACGKIKRIILGHHQQLLEYVPPDTEKLFSVLLSSRVEILSNGTRQKLDTMLA